MFYELLFLQALLGIGSVLVILMYFAVVAMATGQDLSQLAFVGLVGVWDPPRVDVEEAVLVLQSSQVDVKMITGDSRETGEAIGKLHAFIMFSSFLHLLCYPFAVLQLSAYV